METTHKRWIEQSKIPDEAIVDKAIPFQAKYTELERFNALRTNLLFTHLIKQRVLRKEGVRLNPISERLKSVGQKLAGLLK